MMRFFARRFFRKQKTPQREDMWAGSICYVGDAGLDGSRDIFDYKISIWTNIFEVRELRLISDGACDENLLETFWQYIPIAM